jgi:hypothetical protein
VTTYVPNVSNKQLEIKRLSGYTNVTYAVYIDSVPQYIFKVFANGLDRETENNTVRHLADLKLAPRVVHAEHTFRIEEFLIGTRHPGQ